MQMGDGGQELSCSIGVAGARVKGRQNTGAIRYYTKY